MNGTGVNVPARIKPDIIHVIYIGIGTIIWLNTQVLVIEDSTSKTLPDEASLSYHFAVRYAPLIVNSTR